MYVPFSLQKEQQTNVVSVETKTKANLLGHDCKVTALPEGTESWFTGLDSILIAIRKTNKWDIVKRELKGKIEYPKDFD